MIDYSLIQHSIFYYRSLGFTQIEAPWLVEERISNITKPANKKNYLLDNLALVGSAEQSFLQLLKDNVLKNDVCQKYIATTPCFRDDTIDNLHQRYFIKSEVIIIGLSTESLIPELEKLKLQALNFFKSFIPVEIADVDKLNNSFDIVANVKSTNAKNNTDNTSDKIEKVELGSYGIREVHFSNNNTTNYKTNNDNVKKVYYIYGTACAEPRLSTVLNAAKIHGYHNDFIPKGIVGSFAKIIEEFEETKDAYIQDNPIMELVELSDLVGAIELYLQKYNITMEQLLTMSHTTKRAFINGRR